MSFKRIVVHFLLFAPAALLQALPAIADPLKIGVIGLPYSGSEREAAILIAQNRAIHLENLYGTDIEIYTRTDDCDPPAAVRAAKELVERGVTALAGFLCTEAASAVASSDLGVPVPLAVASSTAEWEEDAPVFRFVARPSTYETKAAYFAFNTMQPKSVLIVRGSNAQGKSFWKEFLDWKGVSSDVVSPTDVSHVSGYNVLYFEGIAETDANQIGYLVNSVGQNGPYLFAENSDLNIGALEQLKDLGVKFYYGGEVNPGMVPNMEELNTELADRGLAATARAWSIGVGIDAIAAAAHQAGTNDPREIIETLRRGNIETFFSPLKFSPGGELKIDTTAVYSRNGDVIKLQSDISPFQCSSSDPSWNRPPSPNK